MNNQAATSHSRDLKSLYHMEKAGLSTVLLCETCSQFTYFNFSYSYFNFSCPVLEKVSLQFTNSDRSKQTKLIGSSQITYVVTVNRNILKT